MPPTLDELVQGLDAFFRLERFSPDQPFGSLVPAVYATFGLDVAHYCEPEFLEQFNGLMFRGSPDVQRVWTSVFLSDEVVDRLLTRGEGNCLLVTHHPLVMETHDRGFLPLSPASLEGLKANGISVYSAHNPLDAHPRVSTAQALAREIGVRPLGTFYAAPGGDAGLFGQLSRSEGWHHFVRRTADIIGVREIHCLQKHEAVWNVAVIPGGTNVRGVEEATDLGCEVLFTGTYLNQVKNDIGQRHRDAFEALRPRLQISLVECSHYASEAVVMRVDMVAWCHERFGLPSSFVGQADPWY